MTRAEHEKNRAAWNEITDVHYFHPDYRVREFLDGQSTLKTIELEEVGDVRGKSLLHLQCQFGLDTLSWARRGAIVTGVDIADQSILRASELAEKAKLDARFVRSDVLELIGQIDAKFDIIFQSYGTYIWLEDLTKWGRVIAHYLRPDGFFYIIDQHPVWSAFAYPDENRSYCNQPPVRNVGDSDYCDRNYIRTQESLEWQHTMADVINALINAGLHLEFLHEFDAAYYQAHEDWKQQGDYWYPPDGPPRYPALFSLKARKK